MTLLVTIHLTYVIVAGVSASYGPGRIFSEVEAGDHGHQQAGGDVTDRRHERRHRTSRHADIRYVVLPFS